MTRFLRNSKLGGKYGGIREMALRGLPAQLSSVPSEDPSQMDYLHPRLFQCRLKIEALKTHVQK
jgi:hypothetical protein